MSLLHDFYQGRIQPHEQREWIIAEHEKQREALAQREERFCAQLTQEQKQVYVALIDEYTGLLPCEAEEIYIRGMRMGAQLTMELFAKKDHPILP